MHFGSYPIRLNLPTHPQQKQHHDQSILHTSKPSPKSNAPPQIAHEIRYLSLFDNSYLRFFTGHEGRVTSLSMSATDDRFLSASVDGTVRLWALQQPTVRACVGKRTRSVYGTRHVPPTNANANKHQAIGIGHLPHAQGSPALVAFDQEGLIFAACARIQGPGQPGRHVLKLFDCRQFG